MCMKQTRLKKETLFSAKHTRGKASITDSQRTVKFIKEMVNITSANNYNVHSTFVTIGASNHTSSDREANDYYATEPKAAKLLLDTGLFDKNDEIWECACGEGHLAKVFNEEGYRVRSSDLIDRQFGESGVDFLQYTDTYSGNIITNPPYKYAKEFVEHAIEVVETGKKVAMFLRLQFLEGKSRRALFDKYPPKFVYVASGRILCAKNGDFTNKNIGSAMAYAWFIWEKGYQGDTIVRWFN